MWNYLYIFSYIYKELKRFVCHNFKVEIRDVYIFAIFLYVYIHIDFMGYVGEKVRQYVFKVL
jgi:hypothetical protein